MLEMCVKMDMPRRGGVGDLLIYVPCTCYNSCAAGVNSVLDRIDLSCRPFPPASNAFFFLAPSNAQLYNKANNKTAVKDVER